MRAVFSWDDAARGYEELYADAVERAAPAAGVVAASGVAHA